MSQWDTFGEDAASRRRAGPLCSVARMLAECIPEEHRDAVRRHIEDPSYQTSSVARALKDRLGDKAPAAYTIGNHRRGGCRCEPLPPKEDTL